jgi:hypothetical protein
VQFAFNATIRFLSFRTNGQFLVTFLTNVRSSLSIESWRFLSLLLLFVRHQKACSQRQEVESWSTIFPAFADTTGHSFLTETQKHTERDFTEFHFQRAIAL